MVSKRRARNKQDKEARKEQLLEAALELWEESSFASFTMSQVAERAGLAKGTTYLYFETKEALLLALLSKELEAWFSFINAQLRSKKSWLAQDLAEVLSQSFAERKTLIRLMTIQASILEYNLSFTTALSFKRFLLEQALETSRLLESCLPFLQVGDGLLLLQRIHALVLGLGQLSEPSDVVKTVLEEKHFQVLRVDFQSHLHQTLEAILKGLEIQRSQP